MKIVFASIILASAAVACSHESSSPGSTTITGSRESAPVSKSVVDSIADARCDREAQCNNVGADRTYASRTACVTKLRGDGMNDLSEANCPNGVDSKQLDKCLADISGERCDSPLDTLSRVAACRTGALCNK